MLAAGLQQADARLIVEQDKPGLSLYLILSGGAEMAREESTCLTLSSMATMYASRGTGPYLTGTALGRSGARCVGNDPHRCCPLP
jgi:hypothetical protein